MKTFKHSGDMGDIIYGLPAMKALGGGVLYLDPEGGESSPLVQWPNHTRTKLNAAAIVSVRELLLCQSYIHDVREWHGETVDYDLDQFRLHCKPTRDIISSHAIAFNTHISKHTPWLEIDAISCKAVISRSLRYHGNYGFWEMLPRDVIADAVYIGLPMEHQYFEHIFGVKVRYIKTPTIYEAARWIGGCERFIGNQNLCRAIAEGFKKKVTVEEYRIAPNTRIEREGAEFV